MRPYLTIILLVAVAGVIAYFAFPEPEQHPREDIFVDSYVELMLLWAQSDTTTQEYVVKRDSVLAAFGLTDSSLLALKGELNADPERLIEIWDKIEQRLKTRRDALGLPSGVDTTKE